MVVKIYDMKLGEITKEPIMQGLLKKGAKLVKITYTFQDDEGVQMDASLKHKDYDEEGEDIEELKQKIKEKNER